MAASDGEARDARSEECAHPRVAAAHREAQHSSHHEQRLLSRPSALDYQMDRIRFAVRALRKSSGSGGSEGKFFRG